MGTTPEDVQAIQDALEALQDLKDNVKVHLDSDGGYIVDFINNLANSEIAELSVGDDFINILGIDRPTSVKGGGGSDVINVNGGFDALTGERVQSNNVNALLQLDGGSGGDSFMVNLAGAAPAGFLVEVFDGGQRRQRRRHHDGQYDG